MRILRRLAIVVAGLVGAYVVLALGFVFWPAVIFPHNPPAPAIAQESYPHAEQRFVMRDGKHLFARVFGTDAATKIVLVHGFGADSSAYERVAAPWNHATGARIVLLDLRGHGHSEGARGRVDYVGQYADDLSDVIGALRKEGPGRIVLAGHSMGGGIVLAYAGTAGLAPVDAYLLIAPALGSDAPTAPATGGPAPLPANFYMRTPRLIGMLMLSMLHVHIRAFDDLPIMYLNQSPPMTYGITAFASMGPRNYRTALAGIKVPLLVIAGSQDEVFRGPEYAGVVKQYSHGRSVLVGGATHTSVLGDPAAISAIKDFVQTLRQAKRSDP